MFMCLIKHQRLIHTGEWTVPQSLLWHYVEVSGQFCVTAALLPKKVLLVFMGWEFGFAPEQVLIWWQKEKALLVLEIKPLTSIL
jgi:hypothetical protein